MDFDAFFESTLAPVAVHWETIRDEMLALRDGEFAPWPERGLYDGEGWRVFGLYAFGGWLEENCRLCPETARRVRTIPGIITAGFSRLAPGARIKPHKGYWDPGEVIRCHLGLVVPPDCGLKVRGKTATWTPGRWLVFDDGYEHEAWNASDAVRTVLLIDIPNPAHPGKPKPPRLSESMARVLAARKAPG